MIISFKVPGEPETATAQQKGIKVKRSRTGKYYPKFYEKPEVREAKERLYYRLHDFVPTVPIDGPIELCVAWMFPRGSKPKRYINQPKDTRPDCDNLSKALLDCMTDLGFWHDDGQIAKVHYEKIWVDDPDAGTMITISPMTEQDVEI